MKTKEISWTDSKLVGKVGLIGEKRLFSFYWRSASKSQTTDKPYTLESHLPGGGKWKCKDFDTAKGFAQTLLGRFLDDIAEVL